MGKTKKRPRPTMHTDDGPEKKAKLELETAPSTELVAVKKEADDAHTGEVNSHGDLSTKVSEWLQEQTGEESMLIEHLLDASAAEEEEGEDENEMDEILQNLEVQIRDKLRGLSKEERSKSFKYECEWKKCVYMSGNDRKYFRHVEQHAEAMEEQDVDRYECEWDLCDFCANDYSNFIGHVHFHAYHTKAKVYGASMSMLMKFPTCNLDSETRNNISRYPTSYTCEWHDCGEKFNKALMFYHHVGCHMMDLFPPDRKSLPHPARCRWSTCKNTVSIAKLAIQHTHKHTKQKLIACFNCGAMQIEQTRYRDHCTRQLDVAYRRYQCDVCDKYFSTKRVFSGHVYAHKFPFPCTLCPRKFQSPSILAQHIRRMHIKVRPMACLKCEYRTYTQAELDRHVATNHTVRKLFRCDEFSCNATFKSIQAFKKHITQHYSIPSPRFACHICQAEYNKGWPLSKHLLLVHGVKRDPGMNRYRYKVDTDGKYRLNSYVDCHRKLTSEQIPYDINWRDSDSKEDTKELSNGEDATAALPKDAGPVVKTKINSISMVTQNEVAIDLGLDLAKTAVETSSQEAPELKGVRVKSDEHEQPRIVEKRQEKKTKKPKKVQEFTVMQRYLKAGKIVESPE
uniref:C2H2-type domain-containing protein n=1 Tax=Anopheles atroparvus TaxID=41427 RepID=A0AAG5CN36_ANOAO